MQNSKENECNVKKPKTSQTKWHEKEKRDAVDILQSVPIIKQNMHTSSLQHFVSIFVLCNAVNKQINKQNKKEQNTIMRQFSASVHLRDAMSNTEPNQSLQKLCYHNHVTPCDISQSPHTHTKCNIQTILNQNCTKTPTQNTHKHKHKHRHKPCVGLSSGANSSTSTKGAQNARVPSLQ